MYLTPNQLPMPWLGGHFSLHLLVWNEESAENEDEPWNVGINATESSTVENRLEVHGESDCFD